MSSSSVSSSRPTTVDMPITKSPEQSNENICRVLKIALPIFAALAAFLLLPPMAAIPLSMILAFGAYVSYTPSSKKETNLLSKARIGELINSAERIEEAQTLIITCKNPEEVTQLNQYIEGLLGKTVEIDYRESTNTDSTVYRVGIAVNPAHRQTINNVFNRLLYGR